MQITLIRHIKTIAPQGMCYGQTDIALPPGYENSHNQIALKLLNVQSYAIWSSPLQRCALLAKTVADNKQTVNFDDRLKEVNFGIWEQKMWSDFEKTDEAKAFFADYINTSAPEGESFMDMWHRIESFVNDQKKINNQQSLLIFTHSGPIRIFHAMAKQIKTEDIFNQNPTYGEISHIQL